MSQSKEDYVKFLYETSQGDVVSNKDIAQGLQIKPSSVSEMILKLSADGLVDYKPYQGVKLTDKGMSLAKEMIRKHEIWEYFLEHTLQYDPQKVHDLAEVLEHVTPLELADSLAEYIAYPND